MQTLKPRGRLEAAKIEAQAKTGAAALARDEAMAAGAAMNRAADAAEIRLARI